MFLIVRWGQPWPILSRFAHKLRLLNNAVRYRTIFIHANKKVTSRFRSGYFWPVGPCCCVTDPIPEKKNYFWPFSESATNLYPRLSSNLESPSSSSDSSIHVLPRHLVLFLLHHGLFEPFCFYVRWSDLFFFRTHNPIWTPDHSRNEWLLAKLWFSCADAQVHQIQTHFLNYHFITETITISLLHNFPPNHPLYKVSPSFPRFPLWPSSFVQEPGLVTKPTVLHLSTTKPFFLR